MLGVALLWLLLMLFLLFSFWIELNCHMFKLVLNCEDGPSAAVFVKRRKHIESWSYFISGWLLAHRSGRCTAARSNYCRPQAIQNRILTTCRTISNSFCNYGCSYAVKPTTRSTTFLIIYADFKPIMFPRIDNYCSFSLLNIIYVKKFVTNKCYTPWRLLAVEAFRY